MKCINVGIRAIALVDDEDFERVNQYEWFLHPGTYTQYARSWVPDEEGTLRLTYLHRFILKSELEGTNLVVDHVSGCGLDNRRENIRTCTRSQNNQHSRKLKVGTSRYKGVRRTKNRWVATLSHNGNYLYIGSFKSQKAAARAYDAKAKELFGEFAVLNFEDTTDEIQGNATDEGTALKADVSQQ